MEKISRAGRRLQRLALALIALTPPSVPVSAFTHGGPVRLPNIPPNIKVDAAALSLPGGSVVVLLLTPVLTGTMAGLGFLGCPASTARASFSARKTSSASAGSAGRS